VRPATHCAEFKSVPYILTKHEGTGAHLAHPSTWDHFLSHIFKQPGGSGSYQKTFRKNTDDTTNKNKAVNHCAPCRRSVVFRGYSCCSEQQESLKSKGQKSGKTRDQLYPPNSEWKTCISTISETRYTLTNTHHYTNNNYSPGISVRPFCNAHCAGLISKHETFQTYSDDIFPELNQTTTKSGSKREAKQIENYFNKYGEFELYNPLIFGQYAEAENLLISTSFTPSSNSHKDLAERTPRKIIQKYGAFDLYEPSVVIKQNSVKGKRNSRVRKNYFKKKAIARKKEAATPFTFFHSDQVRAVHGNDPIDLEQVWGKVRRRSKSVKSSVD